MILYYYKTARRLKSRPDRETRSRTVAGHVPTRDTISVSRSRRALAQSDALHDDGDDALTSQR